MAEREEGVIKLDKKKKNRLLVLDLEKEAHALLEKKGPFTIDTSETRAFSKADVKLLCKWKGAKMLKVEGKVPDKKTDLAQLHFATPNPARPHVGLKKKKKNSKHSKRRMCHWQIHNLVLPRSKWLLPQPTTWPNWIETPGTSCSKPLPPSTQPNSGLCE